MHQLEGLAQLYRVEFSSRHSERPADAVTSCPISAITQCLSPLIIVPVGQLEVVRVVRASGVASDPNNIAHLHLLNLNVSAFDATGLSIAQSGLVGDDTLIGFNGVATDKFEDQAFVWNDSNNDGAILTLGVQVSADIRNDDAVAAHDASIGIGITYEIWRLSRR